MTEADSTQFPAIPRRRLLQAVMTGGLLGGTIGRSTAIDYTDGSPTVRIRLEDVHGDPVEGGRISVHAYGLRSDNRKRDSTSRDTATRLLSAGETNAVGEVELSVPDVTTGRSPSIDGATISSDSPVVVVATYQEEYPNNEAGAEEGPLWFGSKRVEAGDLPNDSENLVLRSRRVMTPQELYVETTEGSLRVMTATAWLDIDPAVPTDPTEQYDDDQFYHMINIETRGRYVSDTGLDDGGPAGGPDGPLWERINAGKLLVRTHESVDIKYDAPGLTPEDEQSKENQHHYPRWIDGSRVAGVTEDQVGSITKRAALIETLHTNAGVPWYGLFDNDLFDSPADGEFEQYRYQQSSDSSRDLATAFALELGQVALAAAGFLFSGGIGFAVVCFILSQGLEEGLKTVRSEGETRKELTGEDFDQNLLGNRRLSEYVPASHDQVSVGWRRPGAAVTNRVPVSFNEPRAHSFGAVGFLNAVGAKSTTGLLEHEFRLDPERVSPVAGDGDPPTDEELLRQIKRPSPLAVIDAPGERVPPGDTVTFDGSASRVPWPDITVDTYEWNVVPPAGPFNQETGGIGFTRQGETIDVDADTPGSYEVILVITDSEGRTDQTSVSVTASEPVINSTIIPTIDMITPDEDGPFVTGESGRFEAVVGEYSGSPEDLTFTWTFRGPVNKPTPGPGERTPVKDAAGENTLERSFAIEGTYVVEVEVENPSGGSSVAQKEFNVTGTQAGEVKWTSPGMGPEVVSSPTVVDGTVFIGSYDTDIYALDAADGTERWRYETAGEVFSSPTVVDGTVFVGSKDNNVYALDASDGTERWRYETGDEVFSSPTVVNDIVFLGSDDSNVYALDASDGTKQWEYTTNERVGSSPAVINDTVFIGNQDGNVYALDTSDGTERWRYETGDAVPSSPTVVDGTVFLGSKDNNVYALDASDGTERWRYETGGEVHSSPTVIDTTVFVGSRNNNVYALDASDGTERWRYETDGGVFSSPTVVDGTVFLGSKDNNVYALDASDGTERWRYETGGAVRSSPTVVDGTVFVGSKDNNVYALSAGVEGSSEGSRVSLGTLGHTDTWAGDPGPTPPAVIGDTKPTDPDGDGLYEDIDGDGDFDSIDVSAFLDNVDSAAVQNNPEAFDFAEDGQVDEADVSALFDELTEDS